MAREKSDSILFRNLYRIPSARRPGWDYTNPHSYFVTICTKGHAPWFGECRNGFVCLSDVGVIVADEWMKTPVIRPYVELGTWVIMPNHVHGVVVINEHHRATVETPCREFVQTSRRDVSTPPSRLIPHSLGSIINQFKSACTKRIRDLGNSDFAWQSRYHDRVIRTEDERIRIQQYIINNPRAWDVHEQSS